MDTDTGRETTETVETSATDADGEIVVWIVTARCDGCRADVPGETWRLCALGDDYSETETPDGCAYRKIFDDPEKALDWARMRDGVEGWTSWIDTEIIDADAWRTICRPINLADVESDGIDLDNLADAS